LTAGDEHHTRQPEAMAGFFSGDEVPVVDRVKGATHDADALRVRPPPSPQILPRPVKKWATLSPLSWQI